MKREIIVSYALHCTSSTILTEAEMSTPKRRMKVKAKCINELPRLSARELAGGIQTRIPSRLLVEKGFISGLYFEAHIILQFLELVELMHIIKNYAQWVRMP